MWTDKRFNVQASNVGTIWNITELHRRGSNIPTEYPKLIKPMAETLTAPPPAPPVQQGQPSSEPNDPFNNAFADLDQITKEPEESPEPPPDKPDKVEKPDKLQKPEKKDEPPKPEPKTETEFDPKKAAPKQLREAYEKSKAELAQIKAERDELKKASSQPKEDPEKKDFMERAERHAKRAQELENELKFAKYEKSEEYQEKYFKPYADAFGQARAEAASLKVTDADGNVRQGTPEDFDTYMGITDPEAAADYAEKVFGRHKATMEAWRKDVRKLGAATQAAIEDFKKKAADRENEWKEQQSKITKAKADTWAHLNTTALEKYPGLFKAEEADARGKELLAKGFEFADRAFSDGRPLKEGQTHLNPLQLLQQQSVLRNKAAAFDYQVYLKQQALAQVKKLQADLANYKKSEPKGGDGKPDKTTAEGWEAELASYATE